MVMHVTHILRQSAVAFHVEADVIFVGHADAAVHLHAFADREVGGAAGLRLGDRDHQPGALAALIQKLLRLHHRGARDFHLDIEMRGAVLEALELADQLRSEEHTSELPSLMRISYAVLCLKKNTQKHTT